MPLTPLRATSTTNVPVARAWVQFGAHLEIVYRDNSTSHHHTESMTESPTCDYPHTHGALARQLRRDPSEQNSNFFWRCR